MTFLAAAMIAVWVLVGAYVLYIGRRQRHLEEEMDIIQEQLDERSA